MGWATMKRWIPSLLFVQRGILHDWILCWFWKLRVFSIQICRMRNLIDLSAAFTHQGFRGSNDLCLWKIWNVSTKGSSSKSWGCTCFWSMWVWHNWPSDWFLIMMSRLFDLSLSTKTWGRPCTLSARLRCVLFVRIERAEESVLFIKHVFEFNS